MKDKIAKMVLDKMTLHAKEHYNGAGLGYLVLDEVGMKKASRDIAQEILNSMTRNPKFY